MMLGDRHRHHLLPAIQVPPWSRYDDPPPSPFSPLPLSGVPSGDTPPLSPYLLGEAALAALSRFLPSNDPDEDDDNPPVDAYACDEFRMYDFKVRRCARGRSHDWTECPFAHPGEKARRRDPRKYHYSGTACPDFRKGSCKRGDACEFAHGVFECWLHPARYRTQPCKDGVNCRRRVCFFAHTPEQLRVLSPKSGSASVDSYDGSPMRFQKGGQVCLDGYVGSGQDSPPSETTTPPLSPIGTRKGSCVNELLMSIRSLQISKAKAASWGGGYYAGGSVFDVWDEPAERVESGRDLRVMMAERLSKENPLEGGPDVGWVSDLLN